GASPDKIVADGSIQERCAWAENDRQVASVSRPSLVKVFIKHILKGSEWPQSGPVHGSHGLRRSAAGQSATAAECAAARARPLRGPLLPAAGTRRPASLSGHHHWR